MARLEQRIHIYRTPEQVWDVLCDFEGQSRWMMDAKSVTVVSDQRTGVGVKLRVPTAVLAGLVVTDTMTVIEWQPPVESGKGRLGVEHNGAIISGTGEFELCPTQTVDNQVGTVATWKEQFRLPLGIVGEVVGQVAARSYLTWLFKKNLKNLKEVCEAPWI